VRGKKRRGRNARRERRLYHVNRRRKKGEKHAKPTREREWKTLYAEQGLLPPRAEQLNKGRVPHVKWEGGNRTDSGKNHIIKEGSGKSEKEKDVYL